MVNSSSAQRTFDPRERLLELSQNRSVSLSALSGLIGRNASYLQQFIRKGSPRKLEESDRRKLAEFFGVDEAELGGAEENSYTQNGRRKGGGFIPIPRLPVSVSAGPGQFTGTETPFDNFGFSDRWLRDNGFDPKMLSVVTVEGDSMEPMLRAGDEVLVDRTPRLLRDGVYVVRLGDTLLIKRVASPAKERLSLLSQNVAYPPVEVALSEVEVIGRVVWKSGRI